MPVYALWLVVTMTIAALGGGAYLLFPDEPAPPPPPPPAAPPGDFDLTLPEEPKVAEPPAPAPAPTPPPAARLEVSPKAVDVTILVDEDGHVRDGSPTRTITLTNAGGEALIIEELLTAGGYGAFGADASCAGRRLPAGAECAVTVTFRPLQPGAFEGVLVVDHSAGENARVRLTGLAQPAATPPPSDAAARLERLRAARAAQVAALATTTGRVQGNVLRRTEPAAAPPPPAPLPPSQIGYGDSVATVMATLPVNRDRILTHDQVIPAVLKSSVSSRIPGQVLATVERDVWSSGTGRLILIPKGTSLIGRQVSAPRRGDARIAVAWSELIRPDGVRIVASGDSADAMGRVGLVGKVDDRFWERYGGAILVSLLGTAEDVLMLQLSDGEQSTTTTDGSTVVVAGQQSTSNFGAIARNMVNETLDLPPVITVAQGTRFSVFLAADVVFQGPNVAPAAVAPATGPSGEPTVSGSRGAAADTPSGIAPSVGPALVPSPPPVTIGTTAAPAPVQVPR